MKKPNDVIIDYVAKCIASVTHPINSDVESSVRNAFAQCDYRVIIRWGLFFLILAVCLIHMA